MATFHAEERGEAAAEFGKEAADAAVARMRKRLEKLKALQVRMNTTVYGKLELQIASCELRVAKYELRGTLYSYYITLHTKPAF